MIAPVRPLWVLVPAYEPDERLVTLVTDLRDHLPGVRVLVVDDGSGPGCTDMFQRAVGAGGVVVRHAHNYGKAEALRTGLAAIAERAPGADIVCVDCDGQHRPGDVGRVAAELARQRELRADPGLVLGVRAFDGEVPLRSRVGNRVMTALVHLATGTRISDTQTGLRGVPAELVPWLLSVPGERFAWELTVLLRAGRDGVALHEVPIETVYLDHNASSHFRPVLDSVRVLAPLGLFAASSLVAAALDLVGVLVLSAATGSLALAVVGARLVSAGVNFTINRRSVFRAGGRVREQLVRYVALALVLLVAGYGGIRLLTDAGFPLLVAKIITDGGLFVASFLVQRDHVFPRSEGATSTSGRGTAAQAGSSTLTTKSACGVHGRTSHVASRSDSRRPAATTSASNDASS